MQRIIVPLKQWYEYKTISTPVEFKDSQHKNWIKCNECLLIMKNGLHKYIGETVYKQHKKMKRKVAKMYPSGPPSVNQCQSCLSKDIRLRNKHWYIICRNGICDKWLHQILAQHDDPSNPAICWKNADISKWPSDCYHVAKIFMPKGQHHNTKMPEKLDSSAILSLMKYSKWFRKDLPNTQILSELIEIRNKVVHSADQRVEDSDRDRWIDKMTQLLYDLNIHGESIALLQKMKSDDVSFISVGTVIFLSVPVIYGAMHLWKLQTTVPITSLQCQKDVSSSGQWFASNADNSCKELVQISDVTKKTTMPDISSSGQCFSLNADNACRDLHISAAMKNVTLPETLVCAAKCSINPSDCHMDLHISAAMKIVTLPETLVCAAKCSINPSDCHMALMQNCEATKSISLPITGCSKPDGFISASNFKNYILKLLLVAGQIFQLNATNQSLTPSISVFGHLQCF